MPLSIERLPGVGKVTGEKLKHLRIQTVADLRSLELSVLEAHFGRYGLRLHELARGIDNNPVVPDRPTQSISVEDTFEKRCSPFRNLDHDPTARREVVVSFCVRSRA